MSDERFAPLTEDFRVEDCTFNIVKSLRNTITESAPLMAGFEPSLGDWAVKGDDGVLSAPDATARENTYPVWDGYSNPDSRATGKATILYRTGFVVKTTKYVDDTYAAGDKLVVKELIGGEKVPSKAAIGEHYVAVVVTPPNAAKVMEIKVVEGGKA